MTKYYQEALDLYGIQKGFVDEQIDGILEELKELYNPDKFPYLSSEYSETLKKRYDVIMAYYILKGYNREYIVGGYSIDDFHKGTLDEQILKLVFDSANAKRNIDEYFISDLVEIIVCTSELNDYVKKIEFGKYDKLSLGSYNNRTLKIYFSNLYDRIKNRTLSRFSDFEKSYNPYCEVVQFIGHELEHASQKKLLDQIESNDIKAKILQAAEYRYIKWDKDFERISSYPFLFYWLASKKLEFLMFLDNRKYEKNWRYSPMERMAEFSGINLSLNLIQNLSARNSISLPNLEGQFMEDLERVAFDCYNVTDPTLFYLRKFNQHEDCLQIYHMSKELSLEERIIYGLQVYPEEQKILSEEKEKIIQKIRSI